MFSIEEIMNYESNAEVLKFITEITNRITDNNSNSHTESSISNENIESILNFDAIEYADGYNYNSLTLIHIKNAIINEISKKNNDFNVSNHTWDSYIKNILNNNFSEIISTETTQNLSSEIVKVFKHKKYMILWVITSCTNKNIKNVDSSYFYFNATEKNPDDKKTKVNIPMSKHYSVGTDIIVGDVFVNTMPLYYLKLIISQYDVIDELIELPRAIHKLINKNNVFNIPNDTLKQMLYYNLDFNYGQEKKYFSNSIFSEFQTKVFEFYNSLSQKEKEYILCYASLLDTKYTSKNYFSPSMIKKITDFGFKTNEIPYVTSQIIINENIEFNPFLDIDYSLKLLNKEDKSLLMKNFNNNDNILKSIFDENTVQFIKKSIDESY